MTDLEHIEEAQPSGKPLSEEQLLAYLEGRLSDNERHDVERWIATESMESDALEGLQQLAAGDVSGMREGINRALQQQLGKKKKRRGRRSVSDQKWVWAALVIILLLAIAGFAIIRVLGPH